MNSKNRSPRLGYSLFLLVSMLGLSLGALPSSAGAQEEGHTPAVILESVKATRGEGNKVWKITVKGRAPKVPKGTKVEFLLTWRGQTVDSFKYSVDTSRFTAEFSTKKAPVSSDPFMFRTVINLDDQRGNVKKAFEKNEKEFPPSLHPWTDYHYGHEFTIGDPDEIEAERQEIRSFFIDNARNLGTLDQEVRVLQGQIEAGEENDYYDGEKFDEKKWRRHMDTSVIKPIAELQKQIGENFEESRFVPYRAQLMNLKNISQGIGRRVLSYSVKVYESQGLTPAEEDTKPEKLDIETRGKRIPSDNQLKRAFKALQESLTPAEPKQGEEGSQ